MPKWPSTKRWKREERLGEKTLRNGLMDHMSKNGMDFITDIEEGQRVFDEANGKARLSAKRRALETVSISRDERHQQTAISSADGAKVLKNLESLANKYENSPNTKEKTFLGELAESLGISAKDKSSRYATFETKNDKIITIRLSNHNAKVSNFDNMDGSDGISIVVSPKKSEGITNDGDAHVMEYYYDALKLRRADGSPLASIVESLKQSLYSGEFKDKTGLAEVQEVNGNDIETTRPKFFRTADGVAYGFTIGGKIYVDPRIAGSETPIHEYAHLWATAMRNGNPKEWKNIVNLMKGTSVWDEVVKKYPELKNEDDIADEVLAHFSGRRGAERLRQMQSEIAKGKGSATEKADAISAIEKVKNALKSFWKNVADFLHIHYTSAEEVADRVMKDMLDGVDPRRYGKDDRVRKQFVGEKGAKNLDHAEEVSTRLDNLGVAREMEGAKKDAKSIKLATGWERGADGKWRYETPDFLVKDFAKTYSKAVEEKTDKEALERFKAVEKELGTVQKRASELSWSDYRTEEESAELRDLDKKLDGLYEERAKLKAEVEASQVVTLGDLSKDNELLKAYPEIGDIKVEVTNLDGFYAKFLPSENKILINEKHTDLGTTAIVHELQHAIQHIEGFSDGATAGSVRGRLVDYMNGNESAIGKDLTDRYKNALKTKSNDELYHNVAGEVEARNVQARMGLSPEERRASLASETEDVSREDQIFLGVDSGEGSESAMGSRTTKKMSEIRKLYDGKNLAGEVKSIVDVFSGKEKRKSVSFSDNEGNARMMEFAQGAEPKSGAKHAIFRHLNDGNSHIVLEDIPKIYDVLSHGVREESGGKASYVLDSDGVEYTVISEIGTKGKENFVTFYTNRKASPSSSQNTNLIAQTEDGDALSDAKLENNSETAKSDEGKLFRTSKELDEEFGKRWIEEQTNEDGRHTTQVKNTVNSYKKFGDWVKEDSKGREVSVLDASSGLGVGTEWMRENGINADDVEPYPSKDRSKPTFTSYDDIDKKYDYIISNAVLNVIPDDWRADVLHKMADKLNVGGKMLINVRGAETIKNQGKEGVTKVTLDDPSEILVKRPDGSIRAYQKGFTRPELQSWVEKELGDGYSVEIAKKSNAGGSYDTAVVVTKMSDSANESHEAMTERAKELSEKLHTPVRIITSQEEIDALPTERQRKQKGSYNTRTGEVTVQARYLNTHIQQS